ncbi:MAG: MBL fold metallo-hydrolase [Pseudomonadota bacterium]|nr:MBL fold metallo-hydrolase [Pseudomonadota bacterium]
MRCSIVLFTAAMFAATPAVAQRDMSKVEIKVERLAPGVAVLFGAGGNIGLSHGEDGNVLIDDQFAPLTAKIVAAVNGIDPDPVKFVVNTHWHGDHSGGNENLGKAGAVIIAHDNVRRRMSVDQFSKRFGKTAASLKLALPVVTFGQGVSLNLNGDVLRIIHVKSAHTDGDSLVYWNKANVLHMGDTFFHKVSLPFIDLESGGSIDGAIAAVRAGLALAAPGVKIIPGHGPVATRADLAAYLAMLVDVRTKVATAKRAGRSLAQIKAANPAKRYEVAGGFIMADAFVETVYESIGARRR